MIHVALLIINFDDFTSEASVMHVGTEEECKRAADMVPAVAYSGSKKIVSVWTTFCTKDDWHGQCAIEMALAENKG